MLKGFLHNQEFSTKILHENERRTYNKHNMITWYAFTKCVKIIDHSKIIYTIFGRVAM